MIELLSPAGNREKMNAAIRYGADAVYLAGHSFGMRSAADNFALDELKDAIAYAHSRGVRVYVTVNTMPRQHEYGRLREYLSLLGAMEPDALIVADLGVLALVKEVLPHMEIHISTQANAVSAAACRAFAALGAKRVVLARELTLEEIRAIRADTPDSLELEAFIHGSMCVSYSGRCLLSNFFTGQDGNRGACKQPCRWNYKVNALVVTEEKRPDILIPIEEEKGEAFIMSSKDTCMIEHIPALMESGINSFKIEGRMKSAYYTAVVTNAYRMAIDAYRTGAYQYDPKWREELESVSHREYGTGYYFTPSFENANTCQNGGYIKEKAYLADVLSYDEAKGLALCVQKNKFSQGEGAVVLSPGKIGTPCRVEALYNEAMEPIPSVPHPQMRFYIKTDVALREGDILRGE